MYYPGAYSVLVLTHATDTQDVTRLALPTRDLRRILMAYAGVDLVGFVPASIRQGEEIGLVERAALLAGEFPLMATLRPVTDAVKHVADGVLTRTIDRSTLQWVVGPAFVQARALRNAIHGASDRIFHPIRALRQFDPTLRVGDLNFG
ncbi:hypothetical protein [Stomatohabitans albus]|uniref:hypothetical protein n=1 Tax=Stomatohabitans albus TaxID=3110766 RepID=UPI00300C4A87